METAQKLIMEIASNQTFAKKLNDAQNREEFLEVAKAHGFILTEQDIEALGELKTAFENQQAGESLSEDELENVSGGFLGSAGDWIDQAVSDSINWTENAAKDVGDFFSRAYRNITK